MGVFRPPHRAHLPALATCLLSVFVTAPAAAEPDRWWAEDKALHFSGCLMIAGDGYATAAVLSGQESHRFLAALGSSIVVGASKEVYDTATSGHASWRDLTWDVVGAATGSLISWIVDRYVF